MKFSAPFLWFSPQSSFACLFFFDQVENICLHITAGEILCKGPTQATLLLAEDCIQCSDWFPINVY